MKKVEKSIELGGRKLTLSTGFLAQQASAAVLASYGDTVVLATVVAAPMKVNPGYFPLTVDYQEKLYAGGRIKGSRWVKREGRPSDEEILAGRLIDRSIRPLFPKEYMQDVQVIITVLSVDLENSPEILAANATSAALAMSQIPWNGPVGVVKVGLKDDEIITNPKQNGSEMEPLELVVSSIGKSVVMIEAGASEVSEDKISDAIEHAQNEADKIISLINDFAKEAGKKKLNVEKTKHNANLEKKVKELAGDKFADLIAKMSTKEAGYSEFDIFKAVLNSNFEDNEKAEVNEIFEDMFKSTIRRSILAGKRPDGRKLDEVRQLSAQVGILPRTHGSAIFQRGQTQALSITTIGAPSLGQSIESAEGEETKRYMHHYAMPPFSTGETGKVGFPSRREIGHGALAERALLPVIPTVENFPYAIRVVTEIMSSNGSTSMASTCGSTLSLMDAGVPITSPVAGIAMGVIIDGEEKSKDKKDYAVLTDIVGIEDGYGDMDFKVAGTDKGITAMQLDVKTQKLNLVILKEALDAAKKARNEILKLITKTIPTPRENVSAFAPKIKITKIDPMKIGELIGSGGKTIKGLMNSMHVQIDVDDDGKVMVSSQNMDEVKAAVDKIDLMMKDIQAGDIYEGIVKRIQPFGAFVEIAPGKEGMVHVSDMSMDFVKDPMDIVKIGEPVKVRVKEIDDLGRINLSMLLSGDKPRTQTQSNPNDRGQSWGRKDNQRRFNKGPQQRHGPHFPTSRFLVDNKRGFVR